jgi:hypothetical protein
VTNEQDLLNKRSIHDPWPPPSVSWDDGLAVALTWNVTAGLNANGMHAESHPPDLVRNSRVEFDQPFPNGLSIRPETSNLFQSRSNDTDARLLHSTLFDHQTRPMTLKKCDVPGQALQQGTPSHSWMPVFPPTEHLDGLDADLDFFSSSSNEEDQQANNDAQENLTQQLLPRQDGFDEFFASLQRSELTPDYNTSHLPEMNLLASVTPPAVVSADNIDVRLRVQQVEQYVSTILGTVDDIGTNPQKQFVNCCVRAMVFLGQGPDTSMQSKDAINKGVEAFYRLASAASTTTFAESLPNINLMSFIFEVYGHTTLRHDVLLQLRDSMPALDAKRVSIIQDFLDFHLDTVSWSLDKARKLEDNRERVCLTYKAAVELAGKTSPLAVAARYNQAWLMIEDRRAEDALTILESERSICEQAYGIYALHTINWIGTQARAQFYAKQEVQAEMLMREVVLARTKKVFSERHAIYWEVTGRIGLFLLSFAANNTTPTRTQECWEVGEDLLRSALVWRAQWLGESNPQTKKAFVLLKGYLAHRGMSEKAENLYNWLHAELKPL